MHCVPTFGTDFVKPLDEIIKFIDSNTVNNLYVLFITDGLDDNKLKTVEKAKELKQKLIQKEIFSWFNVIGVNEGFSGDLLGDLASIGTQRGSYEIITKEEIKTGNLKSIEKIFDNSMNKKDKVAGFPFTLPDQT